MCACVLELTSWQVVCFILDYEGVCNRILRVASNGTTAKVMVSITHESIGSLFEGSVHKLC